MGGKEGTLTQHGKGYRAGKLISTALAESAVIQIINARICARQHVRCALINGDLAQRLQEYEALNAEDINPETSLFLDLVQRAAA